MIPLTVHTNLEGKWPELETKMKDGSLLTGDITDVGALPNGMASGRPSVAIRIKLTNGEEVVAQTSAALFVGAANAIAARYPEINGR